MNQKPEIKPDSNPLERLLEKIFPLTFKVNFQTPKIFEKSNVRSFRFKRAMVAQSLNLQLPKTRAVLRIRFVPSGVKFRFLVLSKITAKTSAGESLADGKKAATNFINWGALKFYEL